MGSLRVMYGTGIHTEAAVLRVVCGTLGLCESKLFFIIILKCSLPFYTVLTFVLMMQKQWWVKHSSFI